MTKTSLELTLRRLVEYMPEHYTKHTAYSRCVEYLDRCDWGGVLNQLIELTGDFDHYFSDEFWRELAAASDALGAAEQAAHLPSTVTCLMPLEM